MLSTAPNHLLCDFCGPRPPLATPNSPVCRTRYLQGQKWPSGSCIPPSSRSDNRWCSPPAIRVAHSKHKSSSRSPASINIDIPRTSPADIKMSDATNAINMTSVSLPRYLARPAFRPLPTESIAAAAPELADTLLNYIRDGLQAPEVFPQLSTFLYTKLIDHLLATLLPQPAFASLYTEDPTSESVHTQLQQFATKLTALPPAHVLLARAMAVNGL